MKHQDQSFQKTKPNHNREASKLEVMPNILGLDQQHCDILEYCDVLVKHLTPDDLTNYLNPDETFLGFGYGGSESMTLFLEKPGSGKFVRKVLSERLITPKWEREGSDVMLPPCAKAKNQTQYLMNLPELVKPLFPQVLKVIEREETVKEDGFTIYEYIYDMTFVPGIEVSQFVRRCNPSKQIVAALYCVIFRLLNEKIHSQRRRKMSQPTLEQSYFTKIEKRLALAQAPLRPRNEWEIAKHKAAEFWTTSVKQIETFKAYKASLKAYYHYIDINEFELAGKVILKSRNNQWQQFLPLGSTLYRMGLIQPILAAIDRVVNNLDNDQNLS